MFFCYTDLFPDLQDKLLMNSQKDSDWNASDDDGQMELNSYSGMKDFLLIRCVTAPTASSSLLPVF